jgi:hypothetical protein
MSAMNHRAAQIKRNKPTHQKTRLAPSTISSHLTFGRTDHPKEKGKEKKGIRGKKRRKIIKDPL